MCLQLGKSLIFNKPLSKQIDGAAIDSPLGSNLANALLWKCVINLALINLK